MRKNLAHFEAPEDDESLHSVLVTAFQLSGQPNFMAFTMGVLGKPTDGRGWSGFFKNIGKRYALPRDQGGAFLQRLLLWPYIVPFMTPAQARQALNRLDGCTHFGTPENPPKWYCYNPRPIRFCRYCMLEQVRRTGRSYWTRAHNLDSVRVCWNHRIELCEVKQDAFMPKLPHQFPTVRPKHCFSKAELWLANQSRELLLSVRPSSTPQERAHVYRQHALATGYRLHRGLDSGLMAQECIKKFGGRFLERAIGTQDFCRTAAMIHRIIFGKETRLRPVEHLICIELMFGDQAMFFDRIRRYRESDQGIAIST